MSRWASCRGTGRALADKERVTPRVDWPAEECYTKAWLVVLGGRRANGIPGTGTPLEPSARLPRSAHGAAGNRRSMGCEQLCVMSSTSDIALIERRSQVRVFLLGSFRLQKSGMPVPLRQGGKAEQLLATLALSPKRGIAREELLDHLWPDSDESLAGQSLNTLVYDLHRSLGDAMEGRSPISHREGRYCIDIDGGVGIDVIDFEAAIDEGDRLMAAGDSDGAIASFHRAQDLYVGDLVAGSDVRRMLEKERLRARYLWMLARLADEYLAIGDYDNSLKSALQLLGQDPCREDAHRLAMRCYVRIGARAQALRQYELCRATLSIEFEVLPEASTDALYELVRLSPETV